MEFGIAVSVPSQDRPIRLSGGRREAEFGGAECHALGVRRPDEQQNVKGYQRGTVMVRLYTKMKKTRCRIRTRARANSWCPSVAAAS